MENNLLISLENFHIPRWNELPSIDLYLDQVVNLINSNLSDFIVLDNGKSQESIEILTKTMINNYVKNDLIESPIKKKYSRTQLAKLFVICILKQAYSMNDIKNLIDIALSDSNLEKAYNKFCIQFEQALKCAYTKKDFIAPESEKDNLYLLKSVLLSCSYKIYVQNIIYKKQNN